MKLWKLSGLLLSITGVIHTVVGIALGKDIYLAMLKDGFYNSINNDYTRGFAFWFFLFGILLILLGQTLQYYIKKEQRPAPLFLGYSLLLLGTIGCIAEPISGFWLVLPQALLIIFAKRKRYESIPKKSIAYTLLPAGYSDVFSYETESKNPISTDDVMLNFWLDQPLWIKALSSIRNFLVRFVGLKGSDKTYSKDDFERLVREGGSDSMASVYAKNDCETVLLLQDKHLDAYISVYVERAEGYQRVYVATLVYFHAKLGHVYFFFVKPFHKLIVKRLVKKAVLKAING